VDRATARVQNLKQKTKNHNQKAKILLTGCILKKDGRKLKKFCDGIFEIDKLQELPALLKKLGVKIRKTEKKKVEHYLQIIPKYESDITAYVPIMTGCNNFCAYCVVPHLRGREISRPAEEILCEVRNLVKKGVKEIWLLGQNVNSYGIEPKSQNTKHKTTTQKPKQINFPKLLKMVNDIEGDFWVRFTSSHPKDLSDEMIQTFAKCEKASPYFNLPIQSGDNEILKAMNRPYTVEKYKTLLKKTRNGFNKYRSGLEKELAVSTDVIVGFPGETKKQFEKTKKIFQEIGFASAYISCYSPRSQTGAAKLKDNVSPAEKKKREKELLKIIEKSALDFNKKFLNKTVDVLILKKKNDFYLGKTRHHQTIKITNESGSRCRIGKFIKAKVIKAIPYGLSGKPIV